MGVNSLSFKSNESSNANNNNDVNLAPINTANSQTYQPYSQSINAWLTHAKQQPPWTDQVTYQSSAPVPTLSQAELEQRAHSLYNALNDHGFLGLSGPNFGKANDALKNLTPADVQALETTYKNEYSSKRGGRDLPTDLMHEFDDPFQRYQLLKAIGWNVNSQDNLIANNQLGQKAGIVGDPPLKVVGPDTKVKFGIYPGNVMYATGSQHISGFVIDNSTGQVIDENDGQLEETFSKPGNYKIVYEIQYGDAPPQIYSYDQQVEDKMTLAQDTLYTQPIPTLPPSLYQAWLQNQINTLQNKPNANQDDINKLKDGLKEATDWFTTGYGQKEPMPIKAVLVPDDTSQPIALQVYAKQLSNGKWEIIDLTNPVPDAIRKYDGDTLKDAWEDFVKNNNLPAGQIAAFQPGVPPPPPNVCAVNPIWNDHSDGESGFEKWSHGLGVLSIFTAIGGVALLFVPGAEPLGGALLIGSAASGATSAGLDIADRVTYGNFQWDTQTVLDLATILASAAGGGGAAIMKLVGREVTVQLVGESLLLTEKGTSVVGTVVLGYSYMQQIQQIQQSNLPQDQKAQQINQVLQSAIVAGGLTFIGGATGSLRTLSTLDEDSLANLQTTLNRLKVPSDIQDALLKDPGLYNLIAKDGTDPTALQTNLAQLETVWNNIADAAKNNTISPQLRDEIFKSPGLQKVLMQDPNALADLNQLWTRYNTGTTTRGTPIQGTFTDYVGRNGYSVGLDLSKILTNSDVISGFDALPTVYDKQLSILNEAEPQVANIVKTGKFSDGTPVPPEIQNALKDALQKNWITDKTLFADSRSALMNQINQTLGDALATNGSSVQEKLTNFKQLTGILAQSGDIGSVGENFYQKLASQSGYNLESHPKYTVTLPDGTTANVYPDFDKNVTNHTIDVKTGYENTGIEKDQIANYINLIKSSTIPGQDYVFLPSGSAGNALTAAKKAYSAIGKVDQGGDLLDNNQIRVFYFDSDGNLYQYIGNNESISVNSTPIPNKLP